MANRSDSGPPLLLVDVDGVLSLFPRPGDPVPDRDDLHWINVQGIPHAIALDNCRRLQRLVGVFELVWATGWERKANDHLAGLVGLPAPLEVISFEGPRRDSHAHWKLGAVEDFVADRPMAWIDDGHDPVCHEWAAARAAPTLLVDTVPDIGFGDRQLGLLVDWAASLGGP